MNNKRLFAGSLVAAIGLLCVTVYAQATRSHHNGSVWSIAMIQVKPGMEQAYFDYLTSQWKASQEAAKKENLILSYKVLTTEMHGSDDWNMLLMTEYKDLATMEVNEPKQDALEQRLVGDDSKQRAGYIERASIREVLGTRLAREIMLQPKQQ